jgi:hypothetical protein
MKKVFPKDIHCLALILGQTLNISHTIFTQEACSKILDTCSLGGIYSTQVGNKYYIIREHSNTKLEIVEDFYQGSALPLELANNNEKKLSLSLVKSKSLHTAIQPFSLLKDKNYRDIYSYLKL